MYSTILYRSKNIYIRLFSLYIYIYIYSDTTITGFFLHGSTEQQTSGRPWNQKEKKKKKWKKTHLSFRSAEITTTQKYPKKIAKNEREGKKTKTKWFRGFNFFPDFCSYRACVKSAILLCQQRGKKQNKTINEYYSLHIIHTLTNAIIYTLDYFTVLYII